MPRALSHPVSGLGIEIRKFCRRCRNLENVLHCSGKVLLSYLPKESPTRLGGAEILWLARRPTAEAFPAAVAMPIRLPAASYIRTYQATTLPLNGPNSRICQAKQSNFERAIWLKRQRKRVNRAERRLPLQKLFKFEIIFDYSCRQSVIWLWLNFGTRR